MMIHHSAISDRALRKHLRDGTLTLGGNRGLLIYGSLHCKSGKRMKRINRVFFRSEQEALAAGYRPCGHCLRDAYKKWKNESF